MASSEDPITTSNDPPSKPENPFVAFRQFADSQISSLLQGVLGIPSAFSKPNSPRWDVFDEDLRRRDDLIVKQQALETVEARKQDTQSQGAQAPESSSRNYRDSDYIGRSQSGSYTPVGYGGIDLPLYSPLKKSLFDTSMSGDSSWGNKLSSARIPWNLEPSQYSHDILGMIRSMSYNNLRQSTRLHSQNSLLPYLLYSPYSPMSLHLDQLQRGPPISSIVDYTSAFEDLLAITYNKPEAQVPYCFSNFQKGLQAVSLPSVVAWIEWFASNGLLEEPVSRNIVTSKQQIPADQSQDVSSELDMYRAFLRMAQHPASVSNTFGSLFKEVEKVIEKEVGPKEAAILREQRLAFVKKHSDGIRGLEGMPSSLVVPFQQAFKEESNRIEGPLRREDPNRVVATSTTTEHSTDEYGTVETSVTVEKVFADGRVTTTHTSHTEDSACQTFPEERVVNEKDFGEDKKTMKKGWFWI